MKQLGVKRQSNSVKKQNEKISSQILLLINNDNNMLFTYTNLIFDDTCSFIYHIIHCKYFKLIFFYCQLLAIGIIVSKTVLLSV